MMLVVLTLLIIQLYEGLLNNNSTFYGLVETN